MTRLLAGASIIAFACSVAFAAPVTEQGIPASSDAPNVDGPFAFHAGPAFALGAPFAGSIFDASIVLSVTPVSLRVAPELFAPVLTGSREAPAAPVTWAANGDYGLAGRFIAATNRFAGPQDELQPSNLGILAALNGTDPDHVPAAWVPVREQLEQRLIDYAFDFGAEDLSGTIADNERALALFGWNGDIGAPVVAQGE